MNQFEKKTPPQDYSFEPRNTVSFSKIPYTNIEDFLPEGYVTDASEDYTEIIQNVLNQHRNVRFPKFPLLISAKGLSVKSASVLLFDKESKLILQPNKEEKYEILRIHDVSDIKIINPVIVGDKDSHLGSQGEWGMGISIRGKAENIEIYNADISDTWGDGIYLGHLKKNPPKNIIITNGRINNTYRNGISITTGVHVEIEKMLISNSNYNGIKIEPSNSDAVFERIYLKDITTFNSFSEGISVGGFSKLIGGGNPLLELEIKNPRDYGSNRGLFFGMISVKTKAEGSVRGYIKIINPYWKNNKITAFEKRKFYGNLPNIEFVNLKRKYRKNILSLHKKDKELINLMDQ